MSVSNIQYIEYVVSVEDTEQLYAPLSLDSGHPDFFLSLKVIGMFLNYGKLTANETAMAFATKLSQSIFVMEDDDETHLQTTVHFEKLNGFLAVSEIAHTITVSHEKHLEIKSALIHNQYKQFKLIVFPKFEFFEKINLYKQGNFGNELTETLDYFIDFSY